MLHHPKAALGCLLFLMACQAVRAQAPVNYQPLTASERWELYWRGTLVSPLFFAGAAASALESQVVKDPPEWGQGMRGYAERSASWYAIFAIQETVHQGGDALLGYDPRYLSCSCKGFFRRTGHAFLWTLVTKNHAGATRLDVPTLAGAYGSGILAMSWYPSRFEPVSDGMRIGSQQMGFVLGINVIKEFGPELKHVFLRR